jgi:outer membrane protein assembly factor BamB
MIDLTEDGHLSSNISLKNGSKKLDLRFRSVNLALLLAHSLLLSGCVSTFRPLGELNAPAYGALLGGPRRAVFEDEAIPLQPAVAWDNDAGAGLRGTVLLIDSVALVATTNRQLLAFQRDNGYQRWDQRFGNAITSTILYQNNTVFLATDEYDGELIAVHTSRGRRQWEREVGPVRFTPLLDQNVLYVGTDRGVVHALTTQGAPVWRVGLGGSVAETPLDGGTHIVVLTAPDSVFNLRKSDGAVVARGKLPATPSAPASLSGTSILVPLQDSAIVALDAQTLTVQWRGAVSSPVLTAPVVTQDGTAYVAARDGAVYRVVAGQLQLVTQLPHAISASLTLARDHLLLGSYDGTLLAVSLAGEVVWTHRFNDSIIAPVAVGDGSVYVPLLHGRVVKLR